MTGEGGDYVSDLCSEAYPSAFGVVLKFNKDDEFFQNNAVLMSATLVAAGVIKVISLIAEVIINIYVAVMIDNNFH
jgi:hypothetical protein